MYEDICLYVAVVICPVGILCNISTVELVLVVTFTKYQLILSGQPG